jgi:hypothetical protein
MTIIISRTCTVRSTANHVGRPSFTAAFRRAPGPQRALMDDGGCATRYPQAEIAAMSGFMPSLFFAQLPCGLAKFARFNARLAVCLRDQVIGVRDAVAFLHGELNFEAVQQPGLGQTMNLPGNDGGEIAFGSHSLRRLAEYQTEIFRPAG